MNSSYPAMLSGNPIKIPRNPFWPETLMDRVLMLWMLVCFRIIAGQNSTLNLLNFGFRLECSSNGVDCLSFFVKFFKGKIR